MSTSTEHVYALLVDSNPVPDVGELQPAPLRPPHLHVVDSRRDDMQTQTRPETTPAPRPAAPVLRRRWVPALAGAAAVIAVIVAAILLFGSDEPDTPPVITQPTSSTALLGTAGLTEAEQDQRARQMIADWNAGDVAAFFDHLADGGSVYESDATDPAVRLDLAFYMGLGQEVIVQECGPYDLQAEDGTLLQSGFDSGRFECSTITTDQLSGPAGIETGVQWLFRFSEGDLQSIEFYAADVLPSIFGVMEEMAAWIETTHPDVWAATFATEQRCSDFNCYDGNWAASPEAAEEMLRLAPEFLAQAGYTE